MDIPGRIGRETIGKVFKRNWINKAFPNPTEEIKADWEQKFNRGAVWLLLDGLDEMGDTARQSLKFQGWITQAQLIISCRLNLWQANPSQLWDFQTYLTQPFQDAQMQQFIQRWFRNLSGEKPEGKLAESLWSALQTSGKERIKDLGRNPLRLTLLSSIWQDEKGKLPDTTAELYQSLVDYHYKLKKKEFPMIKAERDSLNAGLGKLGKASLDGEGARFRLTHRFVCKYLGERDENSLFDSALKLSWLNEVGEAAENPRERVYAFYHATFQEYFAALAVDDWDYFLPRNHVNFPVVGKEGKEKEYRIFEPQWKQVILFWIGRTNLENEDEEKENFIQELINFEDGCSQHKFYKFRSQFLAAWLIQDFKNSGWTNLLINWLIKTGLGSWNSQTNEWEYYLCVNSGMARQILTEINTDFVREKILNIIDQTDEEFIIRNAIWCLGKMYPTSDRVINKLLSFICKSSKDATEYQINSVHYQAIESLSKIAFKNQKSISLLKELINSNIDFSTKIRAIKTLAKISPEFVNEASEILLEMLKANNNDEVRCYLAIALGEVSPTHQGFIMDLSSKITLNYESIPFIKLKQYLASIFQLTRARIFYWRWLTKNKKNTRAFTLYC